MARNVIIGGVLLHLALGTIYSWGCIQPYVTSYIRLYHPTVTMKDTSIVFASACIGHSLSAPFVGLLQDTDILGLRRTAVVGACLVALATLVSSMATTVFGLAALNLIFGVGVAAAYTCPLVSGYAWMPGRKGTVTGVVVAGFGAGAAVFDALATAVVNPNNIQPDPATGYFGEEVAGRVPSMYLVLGSCYLLLGFFGSWMITNPPDDDDDDDNATGPSRRYTKLDFSTSSDDSSGNTRGGAFHGDNPYPDFCTGEDTDVAEGGNVLGASPRPASRRCPLVDGDEREDQLRNSVASAPTEPPSPGTDPAMCGGKGDGYGLIQQEEDQQRRAMNLESGIPSNKTGERQLGVWDLPRESIFYHLSVTMLCTAVSGLYIAGNYKGIARDCFPDADRFLSILGSVASLFNASGRIVGGFAVDRFGCFPTLLMQASCATCVLLALGWTHAMKPSFFVGVCLMHMLFGSNFAIYPTLTAEFFGAATVGPNYGLVMMVYGVGSFFAMLSLTNGAKTSSQVFLACTCISLAGTTSVALLWSRRRHRSNLYYIDSS